MNKFSLDIVIPTLGRPEKLARAVRSIDKAVQYMTETGANDVAVRTVIVHDTARKQVFGVWNDYCATTFADSNTYSPSAMAYVCDDIEFEIQAIKVAVDTFRQKFPDTDGVLGFNQRNIPKDTEGFSQSAMGMIGSAFMDRYRFAIGRDANNRSQYAPPRPFCPDYIAFCADAELGLFARFVNRFIFAKEAALHHYHPAHCPNEMDETHKINRNAAVKANDKPTWRKRQELGLLWGRHSKLVNGKR